MSAPPHTAKPKAPGLETLEPITTPRSGWLVGVDAEGRPLVDFPGNVHGPLAARRTLPQEPEALRSAAAQRQGVMLLFENGDPRLPVIIGLFQAESPTPLLDAVLAAPNPVAASQPEKPPEPEKPPAPEVNRAEPMEVLVDGRQVVIEGNDEIVLRCGQASITLRRNGKLILKGTYVETHSTGVNRIKGGSVQIN
ncbi:DUF6484 domain-containing protein [Hyalangium versicolor]|uniref:DUF6484 domain-containing protein n=1 Tax=Hyalangium versicolor TaxID=2861190 RepID=UPI001CCB9CD9|nr:DUF6484 domain-containing protein [Hyalangium versicolor]